MLFIHTSEKYNLKRNKPTKQNDFKNRREDTCLFAVYIQPRAVQNLGVKKAYNAFTRI